MYQAGPTKVRGATGGKVCQAAVLHILRHHMRRYIGNRSPLAWAVSKVTFGLFIIPIVLDGIYSITAMDQDQDGAGFIKRLYIKCRNCFSMLFFPDLYSEHI